MSEQAELHTEVLHFKVLETPMCIYLRNIIKVLPLVLVEKLPQCPNYLIGLMNLGGANIPVIDLAIRLGMQRTNTYTLDMSVLLCMYEGHQIGLLVDKVNELSSLNCDALQMEEEFNKPNSFFLASITDKSGSSLLVNVKNVLNIKMISGKDEAFNEKNNL